MVWDAVQLIRIFFTESTLVPWINEAGQHVTFGGVACEQLDIAKFGNKVKNE